LLRWVGLIIIQLSQFLLRCLLVFSFHLYKLSHFLHTFSLEATHRSVNGSDGGNWVRFKSPPASHVPALMRSAGWIVLTICISWIIHGTRVPVNPWIIHGTLSAYTICRAISMVYLWNK